MGFPSEPIAGEQALIDDVALCGPAWWSTDLSPFWERAEFVGSDTLVAGGVWIPGRRARPPLRLVIPMAIGTEFDPAGEAHPSRLIGLERNIDAFQDTIGELPDTANHTRTFLITRASGQQWTGIGHVLGVSLGVVRPSGLKAAAVKISLTNGRLFKVPAP